jgi:hypothetical protein
MTNIYSPFGGNPVIDQSGAPRANRYYIANDDTANYAKGTAVTLAGGASAVDIVNGAYTTQGVRTVVKATGGDGNKLLGFVVDMDVIPLNFDTSNYNPASTERFVMVADDPEQVFEGVCASALTAADMSKNANLTIGTINTSTKVDSTAINATTGTDATFQIKLLGLAPEPGNTYAANGKYRFKINNHCLANIVVGV